MCLNVRDGAISSFEGASAPQSPCLMGKQEHRQFIDLRTVEQFGREGCITPLKITQKLQIYQILPKNLA